MNTNTHNKQGTSDVQNSPKVWVRNDLGLFWKPSFKNIRKGDRVYFRLPDGRVTWSKPNSLLIFDDHVVVMRGHCGTVVDAGNFVRVGGEK